MTQVVFSGSSGTIPNLNQNFTQLYDLREFISTPSYAAATPKLTLNANGNWSLAAPTSGVALTVTSVSTDKAAAFNSEASQDCKVSFAATGVAEWSYRVKTSGGAWVLRNETNSLDVLTCSLAGNLTTPAPSSGAALSAGGTSITHAYSIAGTTPTVTTVPVLSGAGGGIALVRGAGADGVAFVRVYAVAIRVNAGAAPDVAQTLIASAGTSGNTATFDSSGGFVRITMGGGNTNFAALSFFGL
jgi:hypothetical protein